MNEATIMIGSDTNRWTPVLRRAVRIRGSCTSLSKLCIPLKLAGAARPFQSMNATTNIASSGPIVKIRYHAKDGSARTMRPLLRDLAGDRVRAGLGAAGFSRMACGMDISDTGGPGAVRRRTRHEWSFGHLSR